MNIYNLMFSFYPDHIHGMRQDWKLLINKFDPLFTTGDQRSEKWAIFIQLRSPMFQSKKKKKMMMKISFIYQIPASNKLAAKFFFWNSFKAYTFRIKWHNESWERKRGRWWCNCLEVGILIHFTVKHCIIKVISESDKNWMVETKGINHHMAVDPFTTFRGVRLIHLWWTYKSKISF